MGGRLAGRFGDGPFRVGIIGAGFIGEVHASAARRSGAHIVGVAASTPANTEAAVARLGAERGFADGEALAASPDIDIVHICTPNHLHALFARTALAAGKHVVCEKPLAVDAATADLLDRAAVEAGVVATVPFVYRFYPLVREARARLRADAGPIRLIHGTYLQDWLSTSDDDNWRVDAELGGPSRAFADIGSHWCDLVEFVTGDRIESVCAELVTTLAERVDQGAPAPPSQPADKDGDGPWRRVTTEDVAMVLFRTERGVVGSVVISQVSAGRKNHLAFEVAGATATVRFDQEQPDTLWVGRRSESEIVDRDAAQLDASAAVYAVVPPGHPQGYQDSFDAFVADTYRAVQAGSAAAIDGLPTFGDGARAAGITDAVLRSSTEHGWTDVTPSQEVVG